MRKFIIFILSIIIILCSGVIAHKCYLYYEDSQAYSEIKKFKPTEKNLNNLENNFIDDDLRKVNSDYKFWININNTEIDYPVVQGNDNNFYLKHNFDKEESLSGCLFVDYNNNIDHDKNIVIYGHNMRNGTMFEGINNFKNQEFFLNNNIEIIKDGTKSIYEVFSVYVESVNDLDIRISFSDNEDYLEYIKRISEKSLHSSILDTRQVENIITLITCNYEYNDARTIVHAIKYY